MSCITNNHQTSKQGSEDEEGVKEDNENICVAVRLLYIICMKYSIAMHLNFKKGKRWNFLAELPYKCNCYAFCAQVSVCSGVCLRYHLLRLTKMWRLKRLL